MDKNFETLENREFIKTIRGVKILQSSENSLLKEALEDLYYERSLENGYCVICNLKTSKLCSNCGTHYCSDDCQKVDWPKHRLVCEKNFIGNKLSPNYESSANESDFESSCSATENKWKYSSKNILSKINREKMSTASDFRAMKNDFQPKTVTNNFGSQDNSKLVENSTCKKNTIKHIMKEEHNFSKTNDIYNQEYENRSNGGKICVKNERTREENFELKYFSENEGNCATEFFKENDISKLKLLSTKTNHLIVGDIIKVKFTYSELQENKTSLYWVIKDDNISKFENIQKFLFTNYENLSSTLPQKNGVYGCIYNGKCYRGKVISTEPNVEIHCIDIGVVYDYCSEKVKTLPLNLESLRGLAFPIEILQSSENIIKQIKCFSDAVIEVISVNSKGIYQAKLYEEKHQKDVVKEIEEKNITESTEQENIVEEVKEKNVMEDIQQISTHEVETVEIRRSVVDYLKEGYCGVFHLMHSCNQTLYGCLIPENIEDAIDCHRKVTNLYDVEMQRIEAVVGDLVMIVNNDNQAQRGKVISKSNENTYKVYLIDYGYITETSEIFKPPKKVYNSMELACKMTKMKNPEEFLDMQIIFELNLAYMFEIKNKIEEGKWRCILKYEPDDEVYAEMLLEKNEERPKTTIKSYKENYIPLEPECKVIISALSDENAVYIRRIDGSWENDLEEMIVNLNLGIQNHQIHEDNSLSSLKVGDLICAKFEADNIFYRARVLSISGDKSKVLFVDYGNVQETNVNDLKPLGKEFQDTIIFAHKISLYNPKSKIISESGFRYLKDLIVNSTELIMTFYDDSYDSVILSERDSFFAINEFIFDEEIKMKEEKENRCSETAINFLKFPTFSVGEQNLVILHVNETEFMENGLFWASDPCFPDFEYIMGELSTKISNYSSLAKSYIPKIGELCFAQFEGGWYRGMVINKRGMKFEIFFIDFGNTCLIEPNLIREKKSELFEKAPAAVKCIFSGFENQNDSQRQSAINYVKKYINEYLNSVVVEKVVRDSCWVRFPSFELKSSI